MPHHETPSSCSCRLPPGRWGQGGFHYRRPTVEDFFAREMRAQARSDPSLARLLENELFLDIAGAERLARERKAIEDHFFGAATAAAGRPEAYEKCPGYLASVERDIRRRKGEARTADGDDLL